MAAGTRLRTRQGRRPTIHVTVSVETLLGLRDDPGELAGYGPITAQVARRIAAEGTWRRLLTDPRTGRFDELSVDTYEPPQDMRDHVMARDPVCIGLGCRLPANRCDLDHRVPHPRGPTAAGNLEPWCRSGTRDQDLHRHHGHHRPRPTPLAWVARATPTSSTTPPAQAPHES